MRQTYGPENVFICTLSTAKGTVTAASKRGAPPQTYQLNEPLEGSYDQLLARVHAKAQETHRDSAGFMLCWRQEVLTCTQCMSGRIMRIMAEPRPHRYVGVCYKRD